MEDEFDRCFAKLEPLLIGFPWANREAYANLLSQIHYWVSHSTRLLALGACRLGPGRGAAVQALHERFLAHALEERGHEELARRDLEAMGFSLDRFPEMALTSAFYQSQYYQIEYQHPAAFFGYVLTLEGLAVRRGRWMLEQARRHHGPEASEFLQVHDEADARHFPRALELAAALGEPERRMAIRNLRQSTDLLCSLLAQIVLVATEPDAAPAISTVGGGAHR